MSEDKKPKGKFLFGLIVGIVLALIVGGAIYAVKIITAGNLSADKIKTAVANYVNQDAAEGDSKATVDEVEDYNCGLYKLQISLGSQKAEAYVTKDGKMIFPAFIDISSSTAASTGSDSGQTASATVTKSDKPVVELFVMSYCPYGTQIEKGIIPAVQALGDKIDFSIKFVSYAMHGQKELDENLTEYCIQKEQNSKYLTYLSCFLNSSDSSACLNSAGINTGKLDSCVASADKQFKVTANFNDKNTWLKDSSGNPTYPPFNTDQSDNEKYSVQGSPTLVVNGAQVDSGRDAASLLKTICAAFNNAPDACSKANLSTAAPSAGFGSGTASGSTSDSGCATE